MKKVKKWVEELQEVRDMFAVNIQVAEAYRRFDKLIKEMEDQANAGCRSRTEG